jgi:hypothetical protein
MSSQSGFGRRLDALIDGALSLDQTRQLIVDIDAREDGCRNCAMAFLEAQSLRSEIRSLRQDDLDPVHGAAGLLKTHPPVTIAATKTTVGPATLLIAVAASFLIAFALGVSWRGSKMIEPGRLATHTTDIPDRDTEGARQDPTDTPMTFAESTARRDGRPLGK